MDTHAERTCLTHTPNTKKGTGKLDKIHFFYKNPEFQYLTNKTQTHTYAKNDFWAILHEV